jgi:uncharacterized protein
MNDRVTLETLQKRIYAQTESPLVLVTMKRMSDFTTNPSTIEAFAQAWFNHWGIGSASNNTGILLLVSQGDRQARIELGADWGRGWDEYCAQIMNGALIPSFKRGDFSGGILAAVEGLANMAVQGPTGTAPSVGMIAKLMTIPLVQKIQGYQSLSPFWGLLMLALGVLSLVLAAVLRSRRGILLVTGALFLVAGFLPLLLAMVPIAVIACFMPISKSRGAPFYHTDTATNRRYMPASSHLGGGMSSGGGGFAGGGGGSSGGGGASGSF